MISEDARSARNSIMMMYEKKKGELAMTQAGLLCRDSWTWQQVAALQRLLPMASSRMHCGLMQRRLGHCDLIAMQEYTGWCILQGLDVTELGPQPLYKQDRALLYNGTLGQRHPADSSKGLDHLLPPGLGKWVTLQQPRLCCRPFRRMPGLSRKCASSSMPFADGELLCLVVLHDFGASSNPSARLWRPWRTL